MHRRIGNAYEEGETGASGEERQDWSAGSGGNKSGVIAEGRAAAQAMGGALVSVTSAAPQEGMLAVLFGSRVSRSFRTSSHAAAFFLRSPFSLTDTSLAPP